MRGQRMITSKLRTLLSGWAGTGDGASAFLRWCRFQSERLVAARWSMIRALATHLLEVGRLGPHKVSSAIREAWAAGVHSC